MSTTCERCKQISAIENIAKKVRKQKKQESMMEFMAKLGGTFLTSPPKEAIDFSKTLRDYTQVHTGVMATGDSKFKFWFPTPCVNEERQIAQLLSYLFIELWYPKSKSGDIVLMRMDLIFGGSKIADRADIFATAFLNRSVSASMVIDTANTQLLNASKSSNLGAEIFAVIERISPQYANVIQATKFDTRIYGENIDLLLKDAVDHEIIYE